VRQTAVRQTAVRQAGITAAELRADRLLDEAQATGGDPLQLTHLFEISDPTAIRYRGELDQIAPSSTARHDPRPGPRPQAESMKG
jgi:hypothetical protein